jgi:glycosyltransferase involved in cell wall biosynthesis
MKIGIIVTHPTQFDVPVFRLGNDIIDVIFIDQKRMSNIFDPELQMNVSWDTDNTKGYTFSILPVKNKYYWLYKKLKSEKYDLIITCGYFKAAYIFSIIVGKLFSKKNSIRVDTVEYNNVSGYKKLQKRGLYKLLGLFIDHYFVASSLTKNFLIANKVEERNISFFGYVIETEVFKNASNLHEAEKYSLREELNIPNNCNILLCVSKHNQREAPFDTIEAFAKLNRKDLHLLLIGDGPMHTALQQRIRELGIEDSVALPGYISYTLLPKYYGLASVFIHDSHDEPWGVSVHEAIASGLPVVASDRVGAAIDQIINGSNGFIFKHGDVAELTKCIKEVLLLSKEIILDSNQRVLNQFTYEIILDNIKLVAAGSA